MSDSSSGDDSVELIVEGDEKTVTGFIRGLFIGARNAQWPVFHDERGIENQTFAEQLKGWVGLTEPLTHFVVDEDSVQLVRAALADPRCHGMKLREAQPVLSASFGFKLKVFTEEAAAQVRAVYEQVPSDVTVERWDPKETRRDGDTEGVELYSPVHHYKMEAEGIVKGPFRHVLYVHEQARRIEQVDEEEMRLVLGDSLL